MNEGSMSYFLAHLMKRILCQETCTCNAYQMTQFAMFYTLTRLMNVNADNVSSNALFFLFQSSHALCFAMYNLAKNPNAQARLQNEVDTVCKGNNCTSENLQNMPFLKAVVKESLRYISYSNMFITNYTSIYMYKFSKITMTLLYDI